MWTGWFLSDVLKPCLPCVRLCSQILLILHGVVWLNAAGTVWKEAEPVPITNQNQQSRSTIDLPLAPEFRDALTRHLLSCSPVQPIRFARLVERRLNSRTNSHLSSFIPASRAASPSSKALAATSSAVWPTRQAKKDSCICTYYLPSSALHQCSFSAGIPTGREVCSQSARR